MIHEPIDLFELAPSKCHPFYTQLFASERMADVRQHINTMWQWYAGRGLADAHFVSEFPIRTSQRWWELETAWLLRNCGFNLSKRHAGSDFRCERENIAFEVEAVVAGPGTEDHPDLVPEYPLTGSGRFQTSETINIPERERIELLRLTNAIDVKARKHLCDLEKGNSDPSVPFVIALSSVDLALMVAEWDMPAALKAVYPIGGQCYDLDPATGEFLSRRWQCRPQVNKGTPSRAAITTQVFCPGCGSAHHREVSALLYSTLNIREAGYPYPPREHQKRFVVIHNEDCTKPLAKGSIRTGAEYWLEPTGTNEYALAESRIGQSEQGTGGDK
jgi:hypothetical protein